MLPAWPCGKCGCSEEDERVNHVCGDNTTNPRTSPASGACCYGFDNKGRHDPGCIYYQGTRVAEFETGATRSSENLYDPEGFLSPIVLERYCKYMEKHRVQADGEIRNSDNWQKGMPINRYFRSWMRHTFDVWRAWRHGDVPVDSLIDALCAVMFNVQGIILALMIQNGMTGKPKIRSEDVPE